MITNFQVDVVKERKRILDREKAQGKYDHNNNESASKEENEARKKKRTRLWTLELHQRFIEALSELGSRRSNFLLMTY